MLNIYAILFVKVDVIETDVISLSASEPLSKAMKLLLALPGLEMRGADHKITG